MLAIANALIFAFCAFYLHQGMKYDVEENKKEQIPPIIQILYYTYVIMAAINLCSLAF